MWALYLPLEQLESVNLGPPTPQWKTMPMSFDVGIANQLLIHIFPCNFLCSRRSATVSAFYIKKLECFVVRVGAWFSARDPRKGCFYLAFSNKKLKSLVDVGVYL